MKELGMITIDNKFYQEKQKKKDMICQNKIKMKNYGEELRYSSIYKIPVIKDILMNLKVSILFLENFLKNLKI